MTIMNRNQIADLLEMSPTTVDGLVKDGMPFITKPGDDGGRWSFNLAEVFKWAMAYGVTDEGDSMEKEAKLARQRADIANAGLRELELDVKSRELVRIDDIIYIFEEAEGIVKSRIQAIPGRLGQPISIVTDATVCTAMLKNEVNEALEAISTGIPERLAVLRAEVS